MNSITRTVGLCLGLLLPTLSFHAPLRPSRGTSPLFAVPKVVVAGGGFGGLYTALRLAELGKTDNKKGEFPYEITLIDRNERFAFLPLLYELVTGDATEEDVAPEFLTLLLSSGINFVQADVKSFDLANKRIRVSKKNAWAESSEEQSIDYDKLVIGLGASPAVDFVPGAKEHALPFYSVQDAMILKDQVAELDKLNKDTPSLFRVVIIGGSYSGVELASNLVPRLGRNRCTVTIVDRGYKILPAASEYNRAVANRRLQEQKVELLLGMDVVRIEEGRVIVAERGGLSNGQTVLSADLIVWTAGASINPVVKTLDIPKDERGRIVVRSDLRTVGDPNTYALGDVATVEGKELGTTAQVAFQQSDYLAWNLWASLTGRARPLNFQYTHLGEMLTLGSKDGSVNALSDLIMFEGPAASAARRLAYIFRMPTNTQRAQTFFSWVLNPLQKEVPGIKEKM